MKWTIVQIQTIQRFRQVSGYEKWWLFRSKSKHRSQHTFYDFHRSVLTVKIEVSVHVLVYISLFTLNSLLFSHPHFLFFFSNCPFVDSRAETFFFIYVWKCAISLFKWISKAVFPLRSYFKMNNFSTLCSTV